MRLASYETRLELFLTHYEYRQLRSPNRVNIEFDDQWKINQKEYIGRVIATEEGTHSIYSLPHTNSEHPHHITIQKNHLSNFGFPIFGAEKMISKPDPEDIKALLIPRPHMTTPLRKVLRKTQKFTKGRIVRTADIPRLDVVYLKQCVDFINNARAAYGDQFTLSLEGGSLKVLLEF